MFTQQEGKRKQRTVAPAKSREGGKADSNVKKEGLSILVQLRS